MASTRFELHRRPAERVAEDAAEKIAHHAGQAVQTSASDRVHVVTGRLRTSIGYEVVSPGIEGAHRTAFIGSEVEYALYEELLHPYLRPALDALRGLDYGRGAAR